MNSIFLTSPNVLPASHIFYVTEDKLDLQFSDICEQVRALASGGPMNAVDTGLPA